MSGASVTFRKHDAQKQIGKNKDSATIKEFLRKPQKVAGKWKE
jgi:hypothetical protein